VRVVSRGGIAASPGALRDSACGFSLDGCSVEGPRTIGQRVFSFDLTPFGARRSVLALMARAAAAWVSVIQPSLSRACRQ
jgi:hypothetical protein